MGIQHKRILSALDSGSLTSLSAWKELGIARLSARISELRFQGYPIEGTRIETVNQFGEPTHYTLYTMDKNKVPELLRVAK